MYAKGRGAQTAIDIRQIEHSDECEELASVSFLLDVDLPKSRNRLCVETLYAMLLWINRLSTWDSLVIIERLLPSTVALDANLDASKYHLFSASKVNAKLHDIAIVHRPWS